MPRDYAVARQVVADALGFCKAPCHTCFRMRTARLQQLIPSRPGLITQQSARSTHFSMTAIGPNTFGRLTLRHSKDLDFAPNWRESFPRWKHRTPSCLPFVSQANCRKTTQLL